MDQPYSRSADALLDQQYWAPSDPQKHPYDDTGWSFPYLFDVPTVRVTDLSILKASMERVGDPGAPSGTVSGAGAMYAINNDGGISLLGLRYALKDAKVSIAEQPFDVAGAHFNAGSLIVGRVSTAALRSAIKDTDLEAVSLEAAPSVIDEGFAPGVFLNDPSTARVVGSVLGAQFVDHNSPVAYGYGPSVAVYSASGMAFTVSDTTSTRQPVTEDKYERPTGRGGPQGEDIPEGRPFVQPEPLPSPKPWQATPLNSDQARNNPALIPVEDRPDVILRFAAAKQLLLSGLLGSPGSIAEKAIVVDAHYGHGNVLLFANDPVYRAETIGTYALVFNAILNYDHLGHAAAAAN